MSKKLLVITSSLRPQSNSDALAEAFARGAAENGWMVERVSLRGKQIAFCRGCLSCQKTQRCVMRDDAAELLDKVKTADALAFATPVYYYGMSGQLKTLLDRLNPLYGTEYAFRSVYLLATAADGDKAAMDGTVTGIAGWISCFEQAALAGVVRGAGVSDSGEMKRHPELLDEAYRMGRAMQA